MKITCQSCQAKYTIADEKVVGKTVKIKCKKCGAAIVVNANEAAAAGDAHAQGHEPEEEDGATRVFSGDPAQDPAAGYGTGAGPDWTVNVRDDDQRTMSAAQIAAAFAAGTITGDTYVWRDGMGDWLPLSQVPELQGTMSRGAAPAPVQAAPPPTDDDLNATVAMNPEAAAAHYAMPGAAAAAPAAAAPTAARKAARGGQDLFGAGGAAAASPFDAGAAPATSQLQKSLEQKAVGERNENSVLFSLASLTATEKAAAAPEVGPKKKPARSGLDDIMNMGGGGSMGAAMLAPPPIMAPVIEPPPQQFAPQAPAPMPMQQQMGGMPGSMPPPAMAASPGMGMISIPPPAQKKTPVGLIVGIVVGVLALVGVGVVLATSGGDKEATGENAANSAAVAATSAAPTNTAANTAAPTQTVAANTAPTNTAPAGDPGSTTKSTSGGPAPAGTGTGTGKPTGTAAPTASTAPTTAPTPTATAETPPPSGGGAEFNRAAASSALNAAAGAARGCKKPDGPTGTAKVKVTFAPSGNVTTSQVQGAPFAGTPVGGCIAAAFRSAKVPAFEGSPVSVSKSVTIN